MPNIAERIARVRARIAEAALRSGRDPEDVCLVAVTKTVPVTAVVEAWAAGQRHFGENRPEEGAEKIPYVMQQIAAPAMSVALASDEGRYDPAAALDVGPEPPQPVWHMIGHVQSRKTEMVVGYFDVVHSLDRLKFGRRLSALAVEAQRDFPVLLECNISGEASKYGYAASGWERDPVIRAALYDAVEALVTLPGLRIEGFMTMAPITDDPEVVRPVFASLRGLRDVLCERFPEIRGRHLSMGMTDDFEVAVEEGATIVRVGRAIFGQRPI